MGFIRESDPNKIDPELMYSRAIISNGDGTRSVRLRVDGAYSGGTRFHIQMVGVFMVDAPEEIDDETRETLYTDNTLAIMFPYVRAQITLLTTQPGIDPFYMPPINITGLLKELDKESKA